MNVVRRKTRPSTSRYLGVWYAAGRWFAGFRWQGKTYRVPTIAASPTDQYVEDQQALARDVLARQVGANISFNFPEEGERAAIVHDVKWCPVCECDRPVRNFWVRKDGTLQGYCKGCSNGYRAYQREMRREIAA